MDFSNTTLTRIAESINAHVISSNAKLHPSWNCDTIELLLDSTTLKPAAFIAYVDQFCALWFSTPLLVGVSVIELLVPVIAQHELPYTMHADNGLHILPHRSRHFMEADATMQIIFEALSRIGPYNVEIMAWADSIGWHRLERDRYSNED